MAGSGAGEQTESRTPGIWVEGFMGIAGRPFDRLTVPRLGAEEVPSPVEGRTDLLSSPGANAQLARDALARQGTRGIPSEACNLMVVPLLEELAGWPPGSYAREPEAVYWDSLLARVVRFPRERFDLR